MLRAPVVEGVLSVFVVHWWLLACTKAGVQESTSSIDRVNYERLMPQESKTRPTNKREYSL